MGQQVFFIDASVAGADELQAALQLSVGEDSRVFVLENSSNAFEQMDAALETLGGVQVDGVHIYAHGTSGAVTLGGKTVDEAALDECAVILDRIGNHLKEDADILLYSCNTAQNKAFAERLAALTRADVAASTDVTGSAGNWVLEYATGEIETEEVELNGVDKLGPTDFGIIGAVSDGSLDGSIMHDKMYDNGFAITGGMAGSTGNDAYYVTNEGTSVNERTSEGADTVFSQVADFTLGGTSEVEHIILEAQEDMAYQNATGSSTAQTIMGNALNNKLVGLGGDDSLVGGEGDDVLVGDDATNVAGGFKAGTSYGTDTLVGGKGDDQYVVNDVDDEVVENRNEGTDHVYSFVDYTLAKNVENLTLLGSDDINGTGNELNNVIVGNSGANYLSGMAGHDTLYGDNGDTLDGGAGNDVYYVDGNIDSVMPQTAIIDNAGNDSIYSNGSYDLRKAAKVENLFLSGEADATVNANSGEWGYDDSGSATHIVGMGNDSANRIVGSQDVSNYLDGGKGRDTLEGGSQGDTYILDTAGEIIVDRDANSAARDRVYASATVDLTKSKDAYIEEVYLTGSANINATARKDYASTLYGNDGNNKLTGSDLGDTLYDGYDADPLGGGKFIDGGKDTLAGGKGHDTYYVSKDNTTVTEAANAGDDTVISSADFVTLSANVENIELDFTDPDNALYERVLAGMGNTMTNDLSAVGMDANDTAVLLGGSANAKNLVGDNFYGGGAGNNIIYSYNAGDKFFFKEGATNTIVVAYNVENAPTDQDGWKDYFAGINVEIGNAKVFYLGAPDSKGVIRMDASEDGGDNLTYLMGGAKNDVLTARNGVGSTLNGGAGADVMTGSTKGDLFYMDNVGDKIAGGTNVEGEQDSIISSVTVDLSTNQNISGNIGSVSLTGTGKLNVTAGADSMHTGGLKIEGNDGDNLLKGAAGVANIIDGDDGKDTMLGGNQNDKFYMDNAGDRVAAGDGDADSIYTSVDIDLNASFKIGKETYSVEAEYVENTSSESIRITGTAAGSETLYGGDGGADIDGQGGNDVILAGAGDDRIFYYTGDEIKFSSVDDPVIPDFTNVGHDTLVLTGDVLADDTIFGVETDESGTVTSATIDNFATIELADGATILDASKATEKKELTGNAGDNNITGTDLADTIYGGGGNDNIAAGAGNDNVTVAQVKGSGRNAKVESYGASLDGGEGSLDTLNFGAGNDALYFGDGNETTDVIVSSTAKRDVNYATIIKGFEFYTGGDGKDTLDASGMRTGMNLAGGEGDDVLVGGYGDDTLTADGGKKDSITTGYGNDIVKVTEAAAGSVITVTDFDTTVDRLDDSELTLAGWNRVDTQKNANTEIVWTNAETGEKITMTLTNVLKDRIKQIAEVVKNTGFNAGDYGLENTPLKIMATGANQIYTGGNKDDVMIAAAENVTFYGGDGNDSLTGTTGTFDGGVGHDTITATGDNAVVNGGYGDDVMNVGAKANVDGGAGTNDIVNVAANEITVGSGEGELRLSNVEFLNVSAAEGSDSVTIAVEKETEAVIKSSAAETTYTVAAAVQNLSIDGNGDVSTDTVNVASGAALSVKDVESIVIDGTDNASVTLSSIEGDDLVVKGDTEVTDNTVKVSGTVALGLENVQNLQLQHATANDVTLTTAVDTLAVTGQDGATDVLNVRGNVEVGTDKLSLTNIEQLNVSAAEGATEVAITVSSNPSGVLTIKSSAAETTYTVATGVTGLKIDGTESTDTVTTAGEVTLSLKNVEELKGAAETANTITLTSVEGELNVTGGTAADTFIITGGTEAANAVNITIDGGDPTEGTDSDEVRISGFATLDLSKVEKLTMTDASTITLSNGVEALDVTGSDASDVLNVIGVVTLADNALKLSGVETLNVDGDKVTINQFTGNMTVNGDATEGTTFDAATWTATENQTLTLAGGEGVDTYNFNAKAPDGQDSSVGTITVLDSEGADVVTFGDVELSATQVTGSDAYTLGSLMFTLSDKTLSITDINGEEVAQKHNFSFTYTGEAENAFAGDTLQFGTGDNMVSVDLNSIVQVMQGKDNAQSLTFSKDENSLYTVKADPAG